MTDSTDKLNRTILGATILISAVLVFTGVGGLLSLSKVKTELEAANAALTEANEKLAGLEQTNARLTALETSNAQLVQIETDRNAEKPAYEYDVVFIMDVEWDTKAQELGKQGWEIVSARRASGLADVFGYECITRRRLAKGA